MLNAKFFGTQGQAPVNYKKTHCSPILRNLLSYERISGSITKKRVRTEMCFKDGKIDINQRDVRRSTTKTNTFIH